MKVLQAQSEARTCLLHVWSHVWQSMNFFDSLHSNSVAFDVDVFSGPSFFFVRNKHKKKITQNNFCWRGKWNECKWIFFSFSGIVHNCVLCLLETASFWFQFRVTCTAWWLEEVPTVQKERLTTQKPSESKIMKHKKRHLSGECVNHKYTPANSLLCYFKFAKKESLVVFIKTHRITVEIYTKVISVVFNSKFTSK